MMLWVVSPITQQIISQVERFSSEQQRRVLNFVRSLAHSIGRPGKEALHPLWTSDRRLIRAAQNEGLAAFDPEIETIDTLKRLLDV
jgi:hypothetical protein